MEKTLTAVFDGHVLLPDTPSDLKPNTRYVITVKEADALPAAGDTWDVLEQLAGTIEAPEDWAAEHDHYLYGVSKRGSESAS